jgi:hypothetical protein
VHCASALQLDRQRTPLQVKGAQLLLAGGRHRPSPLQVAAAVWVLAAGSQLSGWQMVSAP